MGLLAFLECLQKSEAKPWTLHIVIQATTENLKTWKERHIISDKYKRQSVKHNSRTCDFTVFTLGSSLASMILPTARVLGARVRAA